MAEIVVPLLIALLICVPVLYASTSGLPRATRDKLLRHLLIGFGLRVGLATLFAAVPSIRVFHEDAASYENIALRFAAAWSGGSAPAPVLPASHNTGIYYFFGAVLYVLGPYPLHLSVLNSLVGTLSAVLLFRIGRRLFDEVVARRAALFTLYFPSMIVWSSMALKDALVGMAILLTTLYCIRLRQRFSAANVIGVLIPIVAIYPIRFYLVYFLVASVVGTMVINRSGRRFAGVSKQLALVGILVVLVGGVGLTSNARQDLEYFDLGRVSSYRRGMATTANSAFSGDADVSTPGKALVFLPIGVTALLWSPFPWQMVSLRPILTLPEMLFWWGCIPALFRGMRFAVRQRFGDVSPILIFVATLLVGYSLAMGNVGAAFRMRAQILNLLFLFASLGHYLRIVRVKRLDEELLWATR